MEGSVGQFEAPKSDELIAVEKRAQEQVDEFCGEPLRIIEELEREVGEMDFAARFKKGPLDMKEISQRVSPGVILPTVQQRMMEEGEPGAKRAELLAKLVSMRGDVLRLSGRLKDFLLEKEASQRD